MSAPSIIHSVFSPSPQSGEWGWGLGIVGALCQELGAETNRQQFCYLTLSLSNASYSVSRIV